MTDLTICCQNLSPMLMNPMTEATLDSLITGNRLPPNKDTPIPTIASGRIYRDENNRMGFPTINLMGALKHAGRSVKNGKKAISTATSTTLFSLLEFSDSGEFIPFDGLDENGELPWKADKRRGVMKNGASSVAVGIIRPRFDNWGFTFRVKLHDNLIRPEVIQKLFEEAGTNAGIGDFRPSKNGPYGRFKVVEFTAVSDGNGNSKK